MRGEFPIKYLKKYYLIPLFFIVIALWFTPRYNQLLYVAKHTMTFIFLGLIAINITLSIFKDQLDNKSETFSEKHYTLFRLLTVFSIITSLTIIAIGQRNYILTAETPPIERCYYYDAYGNYIHGSRFIYNCPTPEVIKTDDTLTMSFEYTYYGSGNSYSGSSVNGMTEYDYRKVNEGASKITVEVHYTENHIIDYYRVREVTNYVADDYTKTITDGKETYTLENQTYITNYYEAIIDTNVSANTIRQNKKIYRSTDHEHVVESVTEFTFNDFSDTEPTKEHAYQINYNPVSNRNAYELMIYSYLPINGYDEDSPTYEGYVELIGNSPSIHIESVQPTYDLSINSNKSNTYTIVPNDNISYLVTKNGYQELDKYTFTDVSKDISIPVLTNQSFLNLNAPRPKDEHTSFQKQMYNSFVFFESRNKHHLLHETNYGYRVESYGQDGVKDASDLSSSIGEIVGVNGGVDRYFITNRSNDFFYNHAPLFDYNPMIKYLLNHVLP